MWKLLRGLRQLLVFLKINFFFLQERNDRFTFTPTASVRIVGADYIVATTRENSAVSISILLHV